MLRGISPGSGLGALVTLTVPGLRLSLRFLGFLSRLEMLDVRLAAARCHRSVSGVIVLSENGHLEFGRCGVVFFLFRA